MLTGESGASPEDTESRLSLLEAEPTSHEDFPTEKGTWNGQRSSRQVGSTWCPFGSEVHLRAV